MILAPSLLSSDFSRLGDELAALAAAGIKWLHWDIMDGMFVPNITFGQPLIKALRSKSSLFFDVHLMIEHPLRYVEDFVRAGADLVVIHAESEIHLERTLATIKSLGVKAGIAYNPGTSLENLPWLVHTLDLVLIMTVNPGFSGQSFIETGVSKVAQARKILSDAGADRIAIEVDGGVCPENCAGLVAAGADVLVSGSSFFGHPPYQTRLAAFEERVQQHTQDRCANW